MEARTVPYHLLDDLEVTDGWLDPEGQIHCVQKLGHAQFSLKAYQEGMVDKVEWLEADGGAVDKLQALGWVRLTFANWDSPRRPTDAQRRFIKSWCQWHGQEVPSRRMPITGFTLL